MAIPIGARLGQYQIVSLVGVGAMGEVYRARDTRLSRDVAIKLLPDDLASDPDRLVRFEHEARVLASLNHPNIAVIHGIEEAAGEHGLVMELVDGETLSEICERQARTGRALPLRTALDIARQIALALEAAHEKGVIHRDLKPSNIKIDSSGVVKVLDFGIAKVATGDETGGARAVTMVADATEAGLVLGTPEYMSPEQARGLPVDRGADVWAFGCVLYEMLTGRRAFQRATRADTLAAVLEYEPDWTALPVDLPGAVRRLMQRCLHKDPRQRLRDIGAARILVEEALDETQAARREPAASTKWPRLAVVAYAAVVIAALAFGAGAAVYFRAAPPPPASLRLSISTPRPIAPQLSAAISPNGRKVAFVAASVGGQSMLWVRSLDSLDSRALPGTEGAVHPFWSPDGSALGFVADNKLKRTSAVGGDVETLVSEVERGGGTWDESGVILFTRGFNSGLWTMPATGGTPRQVTTVDTARGELTHGWPQFLPGGRRFVYFTQSTDVERRGVYLGSLDSKETKRVLATDYRAFYAPSDYLLFVRGETLMAQRFNAERAELDGEAAVIAEGIWSNSQAGQASFSVSREGTIAYVNASLNNRQLSWFDRAGRVTTALGAPDRYIGQTPQLAPDANRVAIAKGLVREEKVWLLEARDGTSTRFSFDRDQATRPVWSGDGQRIMFGTRDSGFGLTIRIKRVDGGEVDAEEVYRGSGVQVLDWSRDGRFAVFEAASATTGRDIWLLPVEPRGEATPLLATNFTEYQAQLSPDGHWIAYVSDETGTEEVYVQRFPGLGGKRQISAGGGNEVRWRGDGRELYFVAADGRLMSAEVRDPDSLAVRPPVPLFPSSNGFFQLAAAGVGPLYDVASNGERFLMVVMPADLGPPITVITNWRAALAK